jgi:hypothetical protein
MFINLGFKLRMHTIYELHCAGLTYKPHEVNGVIAYHFLEKGIHMEVLGYIYLGGDQPL